jgi:hypothetical protein
MNDYQRMSGYVGRYTGQKITPVDPNQHEVFSWESQANQHPRRGGPGIVHRHVVMAQRRGPSPIECLLFYKEVKPNEPGYLVGIMYYYPEGTDLERAGAINVWVKPNQRRQGIASILGVEAENRWDVDWSIQRYTREGAAAVSSQHGFEVEEP